ncbi:ABC transporter substrate-binding protein [Pseudoroseomonas globiformis]|uniref:ABC transporter substrate-binding protein n=1 Tax=Teichococcus globiformis TaxID=2307229 RepID=A0ABV7G386_9PROT
MPQPHPKFGRRAALALAGGATLAPGPFRPALGQDRSRVLRFVPHANLTVLDPLWSTALVSYCAASAIWDRLYGLDETLTPRPQMVSGHELSEDRLHWRFSLREGLLWHDGEKVLARDCVASLHRWAQKDGFGLRLAAQTEEMRALDDTRFEIRLRKPFPQMLFALGATACFMMPERSAATPVGTAVNEPMGSGPFIFRRDEWVSGARAVFERNPRYMSRDESSSFWAGGKPVHFDRIEWTIMPDPSTAASALQAGEVDWVERPFADLVPLLEQHPRLRVDVLDPLGTWAEIRFNTAIPPFNNPKVARALMPALKQADFLQSLLGTERPELMNPRSGVFLPGSPLATEAGLDVLTGPRDLEKARQLLKDAGYDGRPVVMLEASDLGTSAAFSPVARQLFEQVGLKVDYQTMDWGTLLSRTNAQGGRGPWNCYATAWAGLWITNPAMHAHLYGSEPDARMAELRDQWFDAPDLPAQKAVAEQMQLRALERPPFLPCGQYFNQQAFSRNLSGFVKAPTATFWNLRKG